MRLEPEDRVASVDVVPAEVEGPSEDEPESAQSDA
jgi:hypothetical protein